jgi:hypothetical protein
MKRASREVSTSVVAEGRPESSDGEVI